MKISKDLTTGTIPIMVLSILKKEDMYGYKIIKTINEQSEHVFALKEGTLYPILHSFEQEGCVESFWETESGRKRKYYHITKKGLKQLESKVKEYETATVAVKKVLSFA